GMGVDRDGGSAAHRRHRPRPRGHDPLEPQRRDARRVALPGRARLLGPVPPGGFAWAARRTTPVRPVPGAHVLMPARDDIRSILVIGSGPIVIGQACEFDYSGTQACKVLRRLGYRVVLVNSNPATIMTDPAFADATYVEPLTHDSVLSIIEREKPDALLPTLGGQTGLNVSVALAESGALASHGVGLIGAGIDAIRRAEDRRLFVKTMVEAGLP